MSELENKNVRGAGWEKRDEGVCAFSTYSNGERVDGEERRKNGIVKSQGCRFRRIHISDLSHVARGVAWHLTGDVSGLCPRLTLSDFDYIMEINCTRGSRHQSRVETPYSSVAFRE